MAQAQAPGTAVAPKDVIAARQAAFRLSASVFGGLKAAIASGADVKPYAENAKALNEWAGAIPGLFPVGTETGFDTKAKPDIWSDNAGFRKAAADYAAATAKLAELADADDKAGFAAQFKEVGGTCGACHRTYKVKEQ
jgi:cytochrome c556